MSTIKPKSDEHESSDEESPVAPVVRLTKTGQKPRIMSPEHLEKLKLARMKAREVQIKNTALRKLDRQNKAHDKAEKEKDIVAKNKQINEPEPEIVPDVVPDVEPDVVPEQVKVPDIVPEPVKVTKKKPKKKPVIIVQQSDSDSNSDSSDDNSRVIYIRRKKKVIVPPVPVKQDSIETHPPPQPVYQRQFPSNPFYTIGNFKRY
tara:strand:+ start:9592 stop:10203 length:612 start_codon:yes stop_codon:yes gene_type:complete